MGDADADTDADSDANSEGAGEGEGEGEEGRARQAHRSRTPDVGTAIFKLLTWERYGSGASGLKGPAAAAFVVGPHAPPSSPPQIHSPSGSPPRSPSRSPPRSPPRSPKRVGGAPGHEMEQEASFRLDWKDVIRYEASSGLASPKVRRA